MAESLRNRFGGLTPPTIFSAALFLLVLGMFFGNVFIAAGHVFAIAALVLAFREHGTAVVRWRDLPFSARWLGVFLVIAAISVLANWSLVEEPLDHLKKLRYLLIFLLVLLVPSLFRQLAERIDKRDALVLAWLVPLAIAVCLGLIGWWRGEHPLRELKVVDVKRVSGLYGQVMTFAYILQFSVIALAIFLSLPSLWKRLTRIPWWVLAIAILVAGAGLYFSYTRGAMLGVMVGFLAHAMMRSRWMILLVVAIGLGCGTYAYLDQARYKEHSRYFNTKNSLRISQWKTAALGFVERPVFGFGYRNFEHHSVELKKRFGFQEDKKRRVDGVRQWSFFESHAHNNYLEAFASTGVFGGLAYLGFCLCWFREACRSRYAQVWVPLIAAFLVSGFFENTFFDSEVLNCILLVYLFSQIVFRMEMKGKGQPSPGVTITET